MGPEIYKGWENNLNPITAALSSSPRSSKWQVPTHQIPEPALGFVACCTSADQALYVIDYGKGVEVGLQDYEVQIMGGYRLGGGGGVTGIVMTRPPEMQVLQKGERSGEVPHVLILQVKGTTPHVGTINPHVQHNQIPEFCDGRQEG